MSQEDAHARKRAELIVSHPIKRYPVDLYEVDVLDEVERVSDFTSRPIDPALVLRLASMNMSDDEIATVIAMPIEHVQAIYGPIIAQGHASAVVSLKRAQWRSAMRGNVTMLIHLGEKVLNQLPAAKRIDVNVNINDNTDPRNQLLDAVREASIRLTQAGIRALPVAEIIAQDGEF